MSLNNTTNAANVINRAAVEMGFTPQADPYAGTDEVFTQLTYLLNTAGEELALAYPWEFLNKSHQFTTADTDTGDYDLPADFGYMLNQTGWEHTNRVPLAGPLSAQSWTYLNGRKLASQTIYASFRIREGLFSIFPQPPPNGLDINYEYQSKNWVIDNSSGSPVYTDAAVRPSDTVLMDKVLISRFLKVKFMEAKGLESSKAQDDFVQYLATITNKEKGAAIISAGGGRRGFPYLDGYRNLPDTNYGGLGG